MVLFSIFQTVSIRLGTEKISTYCKQNCKHFLYAKNKESGFHEKTVIPKKKNPTQSKRGVIE